MYNERSHTTFQRCAASNHDLTLGGVAAMTNRIIAGEEKFYVYVHRRITNGEPFYVGKGHGRRSSTRSGRNDYWKNIVAKDGGLDVAIIAKNIDEELSFLVEMELIDLFRRRGYMLSNLTDGGEGSSGYLASIETRAKQSAARLGRKMSTETKEKFCRSIKGRVSNNKGKTFSAEWRQKIAIANTGKTHSPETRAKLSESHKGKTAWNKGKKHSAESRLKMSLAHEGKPTGRKGIARPIEVREKIAATLRGRTLTAEHAENISRGLKERKK